MRELLLNSVIADNSGVVIEPIKCPGVGETSILTDSQGNPACVYNYEACQYLNKVKYDDSSQQKMILCEIP